MKKPHFSNIAADIAKYDSHREQIILASRKVLKISKQIIYAVHRQELKASEKLVKAIDKEIKDMKQKAKYHPFLSKEGSFSIAMQEYVEAITFFEFVKNQKLPTQKQLGVNGIDYLLGICDLTGELERKAVMASIKEDFNMVLKIQEFVADVYGEFLKLDLRNGELRKKSDAIKWNLKKIQDIIYDLKLKGLV